MAASHRLKPALVSALLLASLTGCSKERHEHTETYYLVASNIKLPYWQAAADGLNRAAAQMKVKAEFVGPDTYDQKAQLDIFRQVVSRKPTGIMISAADPELMRPEIDAAIAAGIPVVTMDSDAPTSRRLFFIGTNNYQAGVAGGKILAERLRGKGNVVVFTIPAQTNLIERLRGYEDALADTQIRIVQTINVRGDAALAFDKTMELMESGKMNVDGYVCLEATAGKEVAEVLSRRKVQGKTVVAMDTDQDTLDWIDKGMIAATVAQKPFTMAYYGLHALDDLHHNKPEALDGDWRGNLRSIFPSVVDTGSSLITKENLATARQSSK